ncbi:MAG: hypothetical protein CMN91_09405 [Synechococcus sp. ARS1019]|nr:hypothetical protein [Synechococcus sp. ARS1019]|tara:strand:- start:5555 stop:5785 length:231 start_codon:yes stop_codon:yes gene_type:complete
MASNAAELYARISSNQEQTQALFRQALQDPSGAMQSICAIGETLGLPVTAEDVKSHLDSLDDSETNQWVVKARGGL